MSCPVTPPDSTGPHTSVDCQCQQHGQSVMWSPVAQAAAENRTWSREGSVVECYASPYRHLHRFYVYLHVKACEHGNCQNYHDVDTEDDITFEGEFRHTKRGNNSRSASEPPEVCERETRFDARSLKWWKNISDKRKCGHAISNNSDEFRHAKQARTSLKVD